MGSHKDTKALSGVGIQGFGRQWLVKVIGMQVGFAGAEDVRGGGNGAD